MSLTIDDNRFGRRLIFTVASGNALVVIHKSTSEVVIFSMLSCSVARRNKIGRTELRLMIVDLRRKAFLTSTINIRQLSIINQTRSASATRLLCAPPRQSPVDEYPFGFFCCQFQPSRHMSPKSNFACHPNSFLTLVGSAYAATTSPARRSTI